MTISKGVVLQVARLAGIQIPEGELEARSKELNDIVEYVAQLSSVNTRGVPPTSHVHGVVNFFREDVVVSSLPIEKVKENAPDFRQSGFRVPRII